MRALGPKVFVSPEQIVQKSVYLANADKRQLVTVAGPDSLAALVSLCREGFDHVKCARQATCRCADGVSDVLLLTGLMATEELTAVLERTCRLVRDGGVLVVQLQRPGEDANVRAVLKTRGMRSTSTVFDVSAGYLVSHTIERAEVLQEASSTEPIGANDASMGALQRHRSRRAQKESGVHGH